MPPATATHNPLRPEARDDYARGMLRLGLQYAWRRTAEGARLHDVLNGEVHIYRLTTLWDGRLTPASPSFDWNRSPWGALLDELESLFRRHAADGSGFEETAFRMLWPLAEPAVKRDAARWPWIPEGFCTNRLADDRVSGCFAWEPGRAPETVSFHIANACMPDSPFTDLAARAAELLELTARIRTAAPRAFRIGCRSWLNAFPPFLKLFPAGWADTGPAGPVGAGCDWWGQFMARDGGFHRRHAAVLRETMRFAWPAITGSCPLEELSAHLRDFFQVTAPR